MIRRLTLLAALAIGFLPLTTPMSGAAERSLQIAYTAELRGNLLPCFCPSAPLGGLARRVGWIDSLKHETGGHLIVVDAGSTMPPPGQFRSLPAAEREELRQLHVAAAQAIGYDAILAPPEVQPPDDDLPWLAPNNARTVEREGLRLIVVAVHERVDPQPAIEAVASFGHADAILLLCAGDIHFAGSAARAVGAQVAVVSRGACFHEPIWEDDILFLGPGRDGKYVGLVSLETVQGDRVRLLDLTLRPMDGTVPVSDHWRQRVEETILAMERRLPGAFFVGE